MASVRARYDILTSLLAGESRAAGASDVRQTPVTESSTAAEALMYSLVFLHTSGNAAAARLLCKQDCVWLLVKKEVDRLLSEHPALHATESAGGDAAGDRLMAPSVVQLVKEFLAPMAAPRLQYATPFLAGGAPTGAAVSSTPGAASSSSPKKKKNASASRTAPVASERPPQTRPPAEEAVARAGAKRAAAEQSASSDSGSRKRRIEPQLVSGGGGGGGSGLMGGAVAKQRSPIAAVLQLTSDAERRVAPPSSSSGGLLSPQLKSPSRRKMGFQPRRLGILERESSISLFQGDTMDAYRAPLPMLDGLVSDGTSQTPTVSSSGPRAALASSPQRTTLFSHLSNDATAYTKMSPPKRTMATSAMPAAAASPGLAPSSHVAGTGEFSRDVPTAQQTVAPGIAEVLNDPSTQRHLADLLSARINAARGGGGGGGGGSAGVNSTANDGATKEAPKTKKKKTGRPRKRKPPQPLTKARREQLEREREAERLRSAQAAEDGADLQQALKAASATADALGSPFGRESAAASNERIISDAMMDFEKDPFFRQMVDEVASKTSALYGDDDDGAAWMHDDELS